MEKNVSEVLKRASAVWEKCPVIWERCPETKKIEVCPSNLLKLRCMFGVGAVGVAYASTYILPFAGFDPTGVLPQTFASAWQSSLGNVVAGSPFALIQSLGATGTGSLFFGATGVGLTLLSGLVTEKKLDWCTCQYNRGMYQSQL